uniref:structural maintenance of chromosomes protein 4-like n=1 Tax=Styela clava TaxID=7725 RepID=UPI00193AC30D|nr:structural maintenance of chromosomes protein 4-like [Styela clava]
MTKTATENTEDNKMDTPDPDTEPPMELDDERSEEVAELDLPEGITIPPKPLAVGVGAAGEPRLMITHIVNHNFKSYAGVQVLGPFHKSFSGIVGPNGSGKSNVIDSMLFVFGYRSNKLRSKKVSVMIHNSENHKNATSCTVEVHFQSIIDTSEDEFEVVPNSQFCVSRTASSDNSSYYCIDGKRVHFKEVAKFLRSSGIDLDHNRFLILQGEVEQIAMMKPKAQTAHDEGMLEFLEDIIGSSRFKEAIEKLAKLVEELSEERGERLARVKHVEKEKDELEPLRDEALDFLKAQNRMAELQNRLVQNYISNISREEKEYAVQRDALKEKMTGMEEALKMITEERREKVKTVKKISKMLEKQESLCQQKKDKMGELEQTNIKVFEDRKHAKAKAKDLAKKVEKEKRKFKELQEVPSAHERDLETLTKALEGFAVRKKEADDNLTEVTRSLKDETSDLQMKIEEKEKPLMELMKVVNDTKQVKDMAAAELEIYTSNHENAVVALEKVTSRIQEVTRMLESSREERENLNHSLPELDTKLKEKTKHLQNLKTQEQDLSTKLQAARGHLADAEHSSKSAKSQGKVTDFLMQLKTSGKLPGIYGRLGNLGAIDEKYDVAISSCCPALENILVDNIETAQKCVQALKVNNVGQATFIALDKMDRHRSQVQNKPRSALPRLVDLIRVSDEKFKVAFYHALRDTLVASDLSEATKVAYGKDRRWRVVTIKGEIIDTSGTMTGGGNRVVKGRMGSKCVAQEAVPLEQLRRMQSEAEAMETKLRSLRGEIALAEEAVEQLQRKLRNSKCRTEELEQEASGLNLQLKQLEQQKPSCEKEVKKTKPDPNKQEEMKNKLNKVTKEYNSAVAKSKKVEAEKNSYHEQIDEINSRKLKPAQEALDKIISEMNASKKKITKLKVGINTAERNIQKSEKSIEALELEITENEENLKKLEEQWTQLEEEASELLKETEEVQKEKPEVRVQLQECQMALQEIEERENKTKEGNRESIHALEDMNVEIEKRNDLLRKWHDRLKSLKLTAIDGETPPELPTLSEEELENFDEETVKSSITMQEAQLNNMQPNMHAIEEFKKKEQVYLQRVADLDEITEKRNKYRGVHDELRKRRLNEFSAGFSVITNKLKEMYQMITLGGDAELEFVDSLDPFSEGIVFSVRPPKKSWKNICNLSGGEKTLSSLALVFALHHYRPTPLYVMDEIDAALDFKNVSIIAFYIKERTKNAQFIIISLRNNMFELADRLVGIYKTDNCTKSVTIEPALIAAKVAQRTQMSAS